VGEERGGVVIPSSASGASDETRHSRRAGALDRAGLSQSTTAPWRFVDDVSRYRTAGFAAIGVWLQKLVEDSLRTLRLPPPLPSTELADGAAMTLASSELLVSHVVGSGFYTELDEVARSRNVDHTVAAIRIADRLRAPCLVVVPGRLNGLTRRRALDLSAAAISDALERTGASPVHIALEPVTDVDFVSTLDEALDLADLVDHERVGVLPDSFHVLRDTAGKEALNRAAGRIAGVHLADAAVDALGIWTRVPLGEGTLDLSSFVSEIEAGGYAGTYDVELISLGASSAEADDLLARCAAGAGALLGELG
jgi:sugar phosphate isomerase/epimerase